MQPLVEVDAGAERRAFAGEDDDADVRIGLRAVQRVAQLPQQAGREGVAVVRRVERERRHRAAAVDPDPRPTGVVVCHGPECTAPVAGYPG